MNADSSVGRDLIYCMLMGLASLMIGLGINRLRATPLLLAYESPEQRLSDELAQLVAAPPMQINKSDSIDFDEFRNIFRSGSAVILDARDKAFYDEGHIPGALSLPRDDFAASYRDLRSKLDKRREQTIVVYCSGGDCHDSRLVAGALLSLGYPQVKIFVDGWKGWTDNNMPRAQ
jgi:rhodanese-related sulfurtransferase